MSADQLKYRKTIIFLSVLIPVIIASLFRVKLDLELPVFLPPIYASINAITAVLLITAVWAIKNAKPKLHEKLMKTAIGCSIVFLMLYVLYHMTSDATPYNGEGVWKYVYFGLLISHIILSILVIPFVLITYVRAISKDFKRHKQIARYTFPLWLYVAISGVLVYIMISPYYL